MLVVEEKMVGSDEQEKLSMMNEKVHSLELYLTRKVGEVKSDVKLINERIESMMVSVNRLQKTFYGTFIAVFLTYILDKVIK